MNDHNSSTYTLVIVLGNQLLTRDHIHWNHIEELYEHCKL